MNLAESELEQQEIVEEVQDQSEEPQEGFEQDQQDDHGNDVVVTLGEESPSSDDEEVNRAPEWVHDLRKAHREQKRKIKELEDQLKAKEAPVNKALEPGKKPTLQDFDYDADAYERELEIWYERKRKYDDHQASAKREQEEAQKRWESRLAEYHKQKADLPVRDFDEAEESVREKFSETQIGILLQGADKPGPLVYALGKSPKLLAELASINDPVLFAVRVGKLETQLKVTTRKAAPPPEKAVRGSGAISGAVDSTLERLRAEAERTGDMTKVVAYRRQLREKQR